MLEISYSSAEQERAINYFAKCNNPSQFLTASGKIDISSILGVLEEEMGRKYIENHKYAISRIADGRWQTYVDDPKSKSGRRTIRKTEKADLEKEIIKYYKNLNSNKGITIDFVAKKWLSQKEQEPGFKKSSYDRYQNQYKRIFNDIKNYPIGSFTETQLEDYFVQLIINQKITVRVWNDFKTVIRGIFKYAYRHDYTDIRISDVLEYVSDEKKAFTKPKKKSCKDEVFTDDEVSKIEEYIFGRKKISLTDLGIVFAFHTGLRAGELAGLKYADFDIDNYQLLVSRTERHYKNAEGHNEYCFSDEGFLKCDHGAETFFLTDRAIEIYKQIRSINPFSEYLFYSGHLIRSQAFTKRLNYICNKVGIKPRSLHKARKTYATRLISGGASDIVVMSQLRHSDISTTRRFYYRNNRTDMEALSEVRKAIGNY